MAGSDNMPPSPLLYCFCEDKGLTKQYANSLRAHKLAVIVIVVKTS